MWGRGCAIIRVISPGIPNERRVTERARYTAGGLCAKELFDDIP